MNVTRMDYEAWDDVIEWEKLVDELHEDERKYLALKRYYDDRETSVLVSTDFKKIYGANNDKIRKHHIQKKLKNTINDKDNLKLKIDDCQRRIDFLKACVALKIELMRLEE